MKNLAGFDEIKPISLSLSLCIYIYIFVLTLELDARLRDLLQPKVPREYQVFQQGMFYPFPVSCMHSLMVIGKVASI